MASIPALFIGLLLVAFVSGQSVDIQPQESVRRVGDSIDIVCKVGYKINSCRMTVGVLSYILNPSSRDGDVYYAGQGLENGECGAHISNIDERMNGNVTCYLPPQHGNIEVSGTSNLIVASPPHRPELQPTDRRTLREGEELNVMCTVAHGRPAAKITWLLDNEPLQSGIHRPVISQDPEPGFQVITQNLTRVVTADDTNRKLVCLSTHEALDQPADATMQLIVHYKPKTMEQGLLTIFGLKIGSEGRLNVTVRANPEPVVEWTVGDQRLAAGMSNNDGTIRALEPINLGNGFYNCTLILSAVAKEDVDRTYHLKVYNNEGSEDLAVRLSTMDEPAGVELDAGAIVGIVLAVLILLIAVFLIVFAKATDRWCFGEGFGRRDHTKGSGESTPAGDVLLEAGIQSTNKTDTESAVGGKERSRLAELGARVRAALPRGKDKVQATEAAAEGDEKPLEDKKKDVVYAELALGEGGRDKPAPPSTEYAQIVYTTPGSEPTVPAENKEA